MRRRQRTRVPRTVPPGQLRRTLEAIRRLRTNFVFGTLLVLFVVLMGRLAKLQVFEADHYRELAHKRHLARYEFAAQRGRILDRFGRVLAQSRPLRRVAIDPHPTVIKDPEAFSLLVSRLLEGSPAPTYIRRLIEAERAKPARGKKMRRYVRIGRAIEDPLLIDRLDTVRAMSNREKDRRNVYGLIVERGEVREYPNDRHAYHVLGKVPPEGDAEGGFGIERHFNGHLSGRNQKVRALKDRRGRLMAFAGAPANVAYRGGDLTLTLDIVVQHELEEALDEVLRAWQPSELCGIVIDPHTGEVLAWANRPTHNANLDDVDGRGTFHGGYDYVAAGRYEVGSVFKPITVAWALDKGVVRADEILPMPVERRFPGCKHTIHDTHYVGNGTVVLLLEQSSNTGASELARRLGAAGMQEMWTTLRLAQRPPIEFPRAVSGIINPEVGTKRWPAWLYHRVAYGQGNSLTPLQLASLYCALARPDARTVKPAILYRGRLRDPRGPRLCDPKYLPVIRQGMRQVVTQGTARDHIAHSDYPIAGKTGTSQQGTDNVCSFVGMAPAHDPQMICLVMAKVPRDKRGSGGAVAAPAVARVLDATLDYIRLPKSRPVVSAPEGAAARVPDAGAGRVMFSTGGDR